MGVSYRKHRATEPLLAVSADMPFWAYDKAAALAESGERVEMPVAFNHESYGRVAGMLERMTPLGNGNAHKLPDFELEIRGRSGKIARVKLLESHAMIYHTFAEADEDVAKWRAI